jgi:hypothetical protein
MNSNYSRKTPAQLKEAVEAYMNGYLGELICARQIWYEGVEGHGVPTLEEVAAMEEALSGVAGWKAVGSARYEKYGVQSSFKRAEVLNSLPDAPGKIMVQHLFKVNSLYKAPDGKVFKIVLSEVYNLRCFEVRDGQLVGGMVKIHPASDYAKFLVEC